MTHQPAAVNKLELLASFGQVRSNHPELQSYKIICLDQLTNYQRRIISADQCCQEYATANIPLTNSWRVEIHQG